MVESLANTLYMVLYTYRNNLFYQSKGDIMETTTTNLAEKVTTVEQLIGGCNDGVAIIAAKTCWVNLTTKTEPFKHEGEILRKTTNYVEVVSEISLDYDAGYQVHLTAALMSDSIAAITRDGMTVSDVSLLMKDKKTPFVFSLSESFVGMTASENITLTVQNQAVLDFLEEHGYAYSVEPAHESFDMGTGVNVEVILEEDTAHIFTEAMASALNYNKDNSDRFFDKEFFLPSGFNEMVALRVKDKADEVLAKNEILGG